MPNASVQAAAEGLPKITRRSALGAALAVMATPSSALSKASPSSPLLDLFERHAAALAADDAAWTAMGDLEYSPQMNARPRLEVECGRTLVGRDSEGKEMWQASYCYCVEGIKNRIESRRDHHLSMFPGDRNIAARADVEAQYARALREKLDAFAAVEAERKRIEDECGYTHAEEAAHAASAAVKEIERAIIGYVPQTLEEAAQKAQWLVRAFDSGRGYIDDEKKLVEALSAIGTAAGTEGRL